MNRSPHPISDRCPACGSEKHKKVDPDWTPAVVKDRICTECQTRYSPPVPKIARYFSFVMGLGLLVGGCVFLYRQWYNKDPGVHISLEVIGLMILLGGIGVFMAFKPQAK